MFNLIKTYVLNLEADCPKKTVLLIYLAELANLDISLIENSVHHYLLGFEHDLCQRSI